jgi:hypothetical protein
VSVEKYPKPEVINEIKRLDLTRRCAGQLPEKHEGTKHTKRRDDSPRYAQELGRWKKHEGLARHEEVSIDVQATEIARRRDETPSGDSSQTVQRFNINQVGGR